MTRPEPFHFDMASPAPAENEILIRTRLGRSRMGVAHGNHACLVIPVEDAPARHARLSGRLRLRLEPRVLLHAPEGSSECPSVIIECTDRDLLPTFCSLTAGIVDDVERNGLTESHRVLRVVGEWERLFNGRSGLGRREEIGLWGELQFMLESDDIESQVIAWQASARGRLDSLMLVAPVRSRPPPADTGIVSAPIRWRWEIITRMRRSCPTGSPTIP